MASKDFTGSWLIVIILLLICWPVAIIYLLIHYEERPNKYCSSCRAIIPANYGTCPYCGRPQYAPPQGGQAWGGYAPTPPQGYWPGQGPGGHAPAGGRTPSKSPKYCGKCGALTDGYWCPECGAKYEQ
jgi:RNA polymerase subunit RPABC4/transcription elongation factor Spt4